MRCRVLIRTLFAAGVGLGFVVAAIWVADLRLAEQLTLTGVLALVIAWIAVMIEML